MPDAQSPEAQTDAPVTDDAQHEPDVTEMAASDDAAHDDAEPKSTDKGDFDPERAMRTIEQQREAERKAKREAKDAQDALKAAQEQIKAFEREKMTEDERFKAEHEELKQKLADALSANAAADQRTRALAIENALSKAFGNPETGAQSVDAAIKLTDLSGIELDEDGNPTKESVEQAVEKTMTEYPFLKVQRRASIGNPANPSRNQKSVETAEARRARLAGDSGISPFDPNWAQEHGGGVRSSN